MGQPRRARCSGNRDARSRCRPPHPGGPPDGSAGNSWGRRGGSRLDHAARDVRTRLAGDQAVLRGSYPRVPGCAARPVSAATGSGGKVVTRPFPDISGHVVEPETVRGITPDRRRSLPPAGLEVLPRELPVPGIGHHPAAGSSAVSPGKDGPFQAAAGSELPLSLGGQVLARPGRVRIGVLGRDVSDRMLFQPVQGTFRPARMAPAGTGEVTPPLGGVAQVHRPARRMKYQ